jgi:hypothetical protein
LKYYNYFTKARKFYRASHRDYADKLLFISKLQVCPLEVCLPPSDWSSGGVGMNKPIEFRLLASCALAVALAVFGCAQSPSSNEHAGDKPGLLSGILQSSQPVTIPDGTSLSVILDQTLSSGGNRSGDKFTATVSDPVIVNGKAIIPKDAHVEGHVVDANASGRLKGVARLVVALDSVEVDGKNYDIQTSDISRVGRNHNKRNAEFIGGGAGAGALIGGLAGGGKGALIGAAAGAGAGTGAAAYTGKQDVRLPAETRMSFRLTKPVTISVKS